MSLRWSGDHRFLMLPGNPGKRANPIMVQIAEGLRTRP